MNLIVVFAKANVRRNDSRMAKIRNFLICLTSPKGSVVQSLNQFYYTQSLHPRTNPVEIVSSCYNSFQRFHGGGMMLLELAKRRKTIRKFKEEKPPLSSIIKAIEVAKEAPSGINSQPWHFLIVKSEDLKRSIREICEEKEKSFHEKLSGHFKKWLADRGITWKKPFLSDAPYLVIVLCDKTLPFSKESVWISVGYLLLALEEMGLGTVTYTPPSSEELMKLLRIPEKFRIETILPVGYPDDDKKKERRKKTEEVVSFEEFGGRMS